MTKLNIERDRKVLQRQRRYGMELLACSAALLAQGGDCTAVLVLAPLGLRLLLTKQCVLFRKEIAK